MNIKYGFGDLITQLNKNFIGVDPVFKSFFDNVDFSLNPAGYPPYDIVKLAGDDEKYELTLAVAGFNPSDIDIQLDNGMLEVKSVTNEAEPKVEKEYIYKGIAARNFNRKFKLGEYIEVASADYKNGLLTILLERNLPETMKKRVIKINA